MKCPPYNDPVVSMGTNVSTVTPDLSNTCFTQHLVYPTPGSSNTWFIRHWFTQHLVYPTPGLPNTWFIQHLVYQVYPTPDLSNTWFIRHLVYPTPGLSNTWSIQHLVYPTHFAVNRCRRINEGPLCVYTNESACFQLYGETRFILH